MASTRFLPSRYRVHSDWNLARSYCEESPLPHETFLIGGSLPQCFRLRRGCTRRCGDLARNRGRAGQVPRPEGCPIIAPVAMAIAPVGSNAPKTNPSFWSAMDLKTPFERTKELDEKSATVLALPCANWHDVRTASPISPAGTVASIVEAMVDASAVVTVPTASQGANGPIAPGRCDSTTGKPASKLIAATGQAAADGSHRPLQSGGGLVMGQSLEVAEHDRHSVFLRQPIDFLVDRGHILGRCLQRLGLLFRNQFQLAVGPLLPNSPANETGPGSGRDPEGHSVQPAPERVSAANRTGPAGQHQEDRLEGVVGLVTITQNLPANPVNHRPMPLDQGAKCLFPSLITLQEAVEQLSITERRGGVATEERFQISPHRLHPDCRHRPAPHVPRTRPGLHDLH